MEQLSPLEILSADKKVEQLSEEELHCVLKQLTDHSLPEREKCPLVRRLNAEDTAKNSDNSYPSTVASERTSASTPTSSSCSFASSSTTTSSRNCHNSHDEQEVMTTMCSSGNNSHVNNHHHQGANNHHNHSHSSYSSHQQPQAYLQNLSSRLDKGLGGAFNSHAQNLQANSTSFVPQYYQSRTPANSTSTNHCDDSQSISNSRVKGRKGQQSLSSVGDVKMRKPPNRANSFTMPSTNQNISGDRDSSKSFSTSSPYIANMSNSSAKGDTGPLRLGSKNYSSGSPKMNGELANLSSGGGAAGRSGESQQHESHKPPHRKAQSVEVSSSAASPKALSSRSSPSNLVSNSSHSQSDITPSLTSTNSTTSSSTGRPPFTAYNLSEVVKKGNISTTSAQEASAEGKEAGAKILSTFSNNISSSGDNPLSQLSNFVHKYHQSEAPTEGGISSRMLSSEDGEQKSHRISYKGLAPKSGHCYLRKHRSLSLAEEDEEESCDKSASSLCFGEEMNLQSQGQLMEYHSHQSKSKSPSRSKVKEHVDKCLEMSLFSSNSGGANNSYSNTLEENHYNNYQGKMTFVFLLSFLLY